VQDLLADSRIFQWAGIGFGEQESYRLQKSIKKLAEKTQASDIKFFGKILGSKQDYYIVEATVEGGDDEEEGAEGQEEEEKGPEFEVKGTGVNKFTYFVASSSLSDWKKLPDLSPTDLAAARQIKVSFTGELDRNIYTNPFFFG